jgi:REP element-mobilizing transposase RayT
VQTVTFRLADSLPRAVYAGIVATARDDVSRRELLEQMIDEGRGSCRLRSPGNAAIVREALQHFDGERYRLLAWVVMPNHVHVIIEQTEGHRLGDVVRSWKSFSARAINRREARQGTVWATDYFDRYVRDRVHLATAIGYIEENPVDAGLVARAEDWLFSSAAARR